MLLTIQGLTIFLRTLKLPPFKTNFESKADGPRSKGASRKPDGHLGIICVWRWQPDAPLLGHSLISFVACKIFYRSLTTPSATTSRVISLRSGQDVTLKANFWGPATDRTASNRFWKSISGKGRGTNLKDDNSWRIRIGNPYKSLGEGFWTKPTRTKNLNRRKILHRKSYWKNLPFPLLV